VGKKNTRAWTTGRARHRKKYICPEYEGITMFRKIMLVAVPTTAFVVTLFVTDNSSQVFARGGGRGGHGFVHNHRGYGRYFRSSYGYGWGYPSYSYEVPVYEPVAPVCATCEPVVTTPVAPVCTTCEPSYIAVDSGYAPYWGGYRNYRNHGRFFGHTGGRHR
jgi:hypothetical protein